VLPLRLLHLPRSRNPFQCFATTVSGSTSTRTLGHSGQSRRGASQSRRSTAPSRIRFLLVRWKTPSWWRRVGPQAATRPGFELCTAARGAAISGQRAWFRAVAGRSRNSNHFSQYGVSGGHRGTYPWPRYADDIVGHPTQWPHRRAGGAACRSAEYPRELFGTGFFRSRHHAAGCRPGFEVTFLHRRSGASRKQHSGDWRSHSSTRSPRLLFPSRLRLIRRGQDHVALRR